MSHEPSELVCEAFVTPAPSGEILGSERRASKDAISGERKDGTRTDDVDGRGFRTHLHVVMQFDNIMDYTYMRAVLNKLTVVIPMRHGKGWEHRIGTDIEKVPGEGETC